MEVEHVRYGVSVTPTFECRGNECIDGSLDDLLDGIRNSSLGGIDLVGKAPLAGGCVLIDEL